MRLLPGLVLRGWLGLRGPSRVFLGAVPSEELSKPTEVLF